MKCEFVLLLIFSLFLQSCHPSKGDGKGTNKDGVEVDTSYTMALVPSVDALPVFVANAFSLFSQEGLSVNLVVDRSQIDCDKLFSEGDADLLLTDVVRASNILRDVKGASCIGNTDIVAALVASKNARLNSLSQLSDKMLGMTRHSIYDRKTDELLKESQLKTTPYKIQVNDANVRLSMLLNHEIDVAWLAEPWITWAQSNGGNILAALEPQDTPLGAILTRKNIKEESLHNAYNSACDSLNKYGVEHYVDLIKDYINFPDTISKKIKERKFQYVKSPDKTAIE